MDIQSWPTWFAQNSYGIDRGGGSPYFVVAIQYGYHQMKVLHINEQDNIGGAARAMYRLHLSLLERGIDSNLLVKRRAINGSDRTFTFAELEPSPWINWVLRKLEGRIEHLGGINRFSYYRQTSQILHWSIFRDTDIVELRNLHGGYFNLHLLERIGHLKPIIWRMPDMWALTGHCAYSYDCERWRTGCFDCPLLKPDARKKMVPAPTVWDMTRRVWQLKRRLYRSTPLTVVTPSSWLKELVSESILRQATAVVHIPNGIDLEIFRPINQKVAREALGLSREAKVILFTSPNTGNYRKGFSKLLEALDRQTNDHADVTLLTMGHPAQLGELFEKRYSVKQLGYVSHRGTQSLAYSAADLFVFPTLADNQPQVVIEALACGTPIVTFAVGGVPEMVRHMETGYLAVKEDAGDLSQGIKLLLEEDDLRHGMRQRCRSIAEAEYGLDLQAERYIRLYEDTVNSHISGNRLS